MHAIESYKCEDYNPGPRFKVKTYINHNDEGYVKAHRSRVNLVPKVLTDDAVWRANFSMLVAQDEHQRDTDAGRKYPYQTNVHDHPQRCPLHAVLEWTCDRVVPKITKSKQFNLCFIQYLK